MKVFIVLTLCVALAAGSSVSSSFQKGVKQAASAVEQILNSAIAAGEQGVNFGEQQAEQQIQNIIKIAIAAAKQKAATLKNQDIDKLSSQLLDSLQNEAISKLNELQNIAVKDLTAGEHEFNQYVGSEETKLKSEAVQKIEELKKDFKNVVKRIEHWF